MTFNPDLDYDKLSDALDFRENQFLKSLNTSIPAQVVEYSALTQRVSVQPSIQTLMTDGTYVNKPIIPDVPIVGVSGNGYGIEIALQVGDVGMVFFSQRSLDQFKLDVSKIARPERGQFLRYQDAVFLPGFLAPRTVGTTSGISIRSNDGEEFVSLDSDSARIRHRTKIELDAPEITRNDLDAFGYAGTVIATVPILSGAALDARSDWATVTNEDVTFNPNFPTALRDRIGYIDFLGTINIPQNFEWPTGVEGLLMEVRRISDNVLISDTLFQKGATDLFNDTSPREIPAQIRWRWNELSVSNVPSGSDTAWTAHAIRGGHGRFFVGRRLRPSRSSFLYSSIKPPNMASPAGLQLVYRFKTPGGGSSVLAAVD